MPNAINPARSDEGIGRLLAMTHTTHKRAQEDNILDIFCKPKTPEMQPVSYVSGSTRGSGTSLVTLPT